MNRFKKSFFMRSLKLFTPFLALGLSTFAQNAKLSADLQGIIATGQVKVIVQYNHIPTAADHQRIAGPNGVFKRQLGAVAAGSYTLPASSLAAIANDSAVTHVSIDHPIQARLDYVLGATNATIAHNWGATGVGVGVVVIDSGISPSADFGNRVVFTLDFTGGSGLDAFGHGTHVAGIIGGNGANSHCATCTRDLSGMAPGVNLLNFRVLDQNGSSTDSIVIQAIDYAISLKSKYNIKVINLSVGRPVFESYKLDPLCQAVEAAWKAGIVVVVAAGNDGRLNVVGNYGYGTINSPGNDPYALTVGAMKTENTYDRADDQLASYSSKGPSLIDNVSKPDLVAPGNQIVSVMASPAAKIPVILPGNVVATSYYNSKGSAAVKSPYYLTLSGTSMAAAVTSGAVADLLQVQPGLTPDQVKARLMQTAYKSLPYVTVAYDATTGQSFTDYYDIFSRGAGYLDLSAAIQSNSLAQGNSLSPRCR
jgi:serine protease AprX